MKKLTWVVKLIIAACIVVIIGSFYILLTQLKSTKTDLANSYHNVEALNSDIKVTKDKLDRTVYEKTIFISNINDLDKLNKELSNSLIALKSKYDIIAGGQTSLVIHDTVKLKDSVNINNGYIGDTLVNTHIKDSIIDGLLNIRIKSNKDNIGFYLNNFNYKVYVPKLSVFFTKTGEMLVTSDNPKIVITDIVGFIDPSIVSKSKKKYWSFGFQAGFGIMMGKSVLNSDINITTGPYIGVGFNYNIFSW